MSHTLLTGSTGLLGRYLLTDLLQSGHQVAVLARSSRRSTARQRIEDVLCHWEQVHDTTLPRPVVFEGDINQVDCGLNAASINWLATHCDQVLHSAASLAFVEDPESGEPARSNIGGVQNVLGLCQRLREPHLIHVSTAYVCGLTKGVFRENQLDIGQEFANPYESSKAAAERMVRSASGLRGFTILRPSIIAGDSKTYFASTYHGFYAPLRVLQAIRSMGGVGEQLSAVNYLSALGLDGSERKNFVPVDWVSDAAVKIIARQDTLNQTYALVSDRPMRVKDLEDAFSDALTRFLTDESTGQSQPPTSRGVLSNIGHEGIEHEFRSHFKIYESYWRDDCLFDSINTNGLLPDTPCPLFDRELATRLSEAALDANFGFPAHPPATVPFWVADWLAKQTAPLTPSLSDPEQSLTLNCLGIGGGTWTLSFSGTGFSNVGIIAGAQDTCDELVISTETLHQIAAGRLSVDQAIATGNAFTNRHEATAKAIECFKRLGGQHSSPQASMSLAGSQIS